MRILATTRSATSRAGVGMSGLLRGLSGVDWGSAFSVHDEGAMKR